MDLEGDLYSEEHYRIVFFGLQVDGFITGGGGEGLQRQFTVSRIYLWF